MFTDHIAKLPNLVVLPERLNELERNAPQNDEPLSIIAVREALKLRTRSGSRPRRSHYCDQQSVKR
jgi:hypothetical protein